MNFYEHHLGDYAEATAHLTFVEDAAYSRLIRKYYSTEQPIPAELKAAQRLVGARTKEEQTAVYVVLEEFFTLQADGWHNERCDQELERYRDKRGKARASAKISADVRRKRSHNVRSTDVQRSLNGRSSETEHETPTQQSGRQALQSPVPSINPKRPVDNGDNSPESGDVRRKALAAPESAAGLKRLKPDVILKAPGHG